MAGAVVSTPFPCKAMLYVDSSLSLLEIRKLPLTVASEVVAKATTTLQEAPDTKVAGKGPQPSF